jgi:hypothetical protein
MSEHSSLRGRAPGYREVSRHSFFAVCGDLSGASGEAIPKEAGEAKPSDKRGVFA